MNKLRTNEMRYYDTITRTYYSMNDRRKVVASVKISKHSDGREFRSIRVHDSREWWSLELQMRSSFSKLLK